MLDEKLAAKSDNVPTEPWALWLCVALWLLAVACVSLTSDPPGNDLLVAFSHRFHSSLKALRLIQGIIHVALYGAGALALSCALAASFPALSRVPLVVWTLALVTVYGAAMELLQDFVPQRAADLLDLAGDLAGALLALGLAWGAGLPPFRRTSNSCP